MDNGNLPIELWNGIIATLPSSTQKQCLSVCRTWHRISTHFLFSTVRIHFGLLPDPTSSEDEEVRMMSQSWDILEHIANDICFARSVKTVVVFAFAKGHTIFQRRSLAKALKALPHLRSFQWFGPSPFLTWDIAEALASSCPDLSDLRLPRIMIDLPHLPVALSGLRKLQSLSFMAITDVDGGSCEAIDFYDPNSDYFQDVIDFITANLPSLRTLILPASQIWNLPVRVFSSLTELDIVDFSELGGLDLVLHHTSNLQSLCLRAANDSELYPILQNNPSALPSLTSLKIITYGHTEHHFQAIKHFIQGRPLLRKLDLGLLPFDWSAFASILPVIAELEGLKVFGLTMPFPLSMDECAEFTRHLPDGLEAFRLRMDLADPLLDHGLLSMIMQRLKQMQSLSFLSLHRYGNSKLYPFAEDIASDLKQLSLLYLDRNIWDVDRTASGIALSPWSIRRKILKMKEDFDNEDAEWLLRHGDFPPFF